MKHKSLIRFLFIAGLLVGLKTSAFARIKLVALPERGATVIRLDNSKATLVQEERVLALQKGLNKVDFSWKGVRIDPDSIRLTVQSHPNKVVLLNVSYPPAENALVWEISSTDAWEETVRISYLLSNIDRLVAYKAIADKGETELDLRGFIVLRNFSGEDFDLSRIVFDEDTSVDQTISHEETKRLPFLHVPGVPITKTWTFDAALKPWDPSEMDSNVGIPVIYRIMNNKDSGLGKKALWAGKFRVFQKDGHESTIFSGEDALRLVPVGEKMEIAIGDSRDIVVTQNQMKKQQINIRKNHDNRIILYDLDEVISAKIENFKDKPAVLTMIQHIRGQWEMKSCNLDYKRKDAETLEFEIEIPAHGKRELGMHYIRRNVRPGKEHVSVVSRQ